MNIGVIIIFNDNEAQIETRLFTEKMKVSEGIEFCLVDNNSRDNTLQLLKDIRERCVSKVSIVEIKKQCSTDAAKRAGGRYMLNEFNLRHIGYLDVNSVYQKGDTLKDLIAVILKNKELIIDFNLRQIENRETKQTLFKSIFSVADYLKQIQTNINYNAINQAV